MTDPVVSPVAHEGRVTGPRIAAALAGVVIAIGSVSISFGGSLIAMIAIGIAWAVARRRKRPFTRGMSWVIGVSAVGAALLVGFGIAATQLPDNSVARFRAALDSSRSTPPPPPPEWLRRITPPNAQQSSPVADGLIKSRAFTIWLGIMGLGFGVAILAAYAGTLGWMASVMLLYAATGQWPPRATNSGIS